MERPTVAQLIKYLQGLENQDAIVVQNLDEAEELSQGPTVPNFVDMGFTLEYFPAWKE